jgi:hypothetical protein
MLHPECDYVLIRPTIIHIQHEYQPFSSSAFGTSITTRNEPAMFHLFAASISTLVSLGPLTGLTTISPSLAQVNSSVDILSRCDFQISINLSSLFTIIIPPIACTK